MADRQSEARVLSELSRAERGRLFPIVLREHNREWASWYEVKRQDIARLLGDRLVRISHIGSTAVPGLVAKPTIDILAEVRPNLRPSDAVPLLVADGWLVSHEESGPPWQVVLNQGYTLAGFAERVYHLHLRPLDDWAELYFRDFLIDHPAVAEDYGNLKRDLRQRFVHDRDSYTDAKSGFINRITAEARCTYSNRYAPGRAARPPERQRQ